MNVLNRIICIGLFPIFLYVTFFGCLYIYHRYVLNSDPEIVYSLGAASDTTARVWMRARNAKEFWVEYESDADDRSCQGQCKTTCQSEKTKLNEYSIGVVELKDLRPGCGYSYRPKVIFSNGTEFLTESKAFQTLSSTSTKFSFVFGSCMTKTFSPWNQLNIFCDMKKTNPMFGLFLGDFAYMDFNQAVPFWRIPFGQAYLNILTEKCVNEFMQTTPSFIMFDDHEVENDFLGSENKHYKPAIASWYQYIGKRNPGSLNKGDYYYHFNQSNAAFFVLDARTYRSSNPVSEKTFLGSKQKNELKKWLLNTRATFKIIGSPVSWSGDGEYPEYHKEIDELLDFIVDNNIKNVVILSGDMHFGAAYRYRSKTGNGVYEFAASPFQSLPKPRLTPKLRSISEEELFFSNVKFHFGHIQVNDNIFSVKIYGYDIFSLEQKLLFTSDLKPN